MLVVQVDNSFLEFASILLLSQKVFGVKIGLSLDLEVQNSELLSDLLDLFFDLVQSLILLISK